MHIAKCKELLSRSYILCDPNYVTFWPFTA